MESILKPVNNNQIIGVDKKYDTVIHQEKPVNSTCSSSDVSFWMRKFTNHDREEKNGKIGGCMNYE